MLSTYSPRLRLGSWARPARCARRAVGPRGLPWGPRDSRGRVRAGPPHVSTLSQGCFTRPRPDFASEASPTHFENHFEGDGNHFEAGPSPPAMASSSPPPSMLLLLASLGPTRHAHGPELGGFGRSGAAAPSPRERRAVRHSPSRQGRLAGMPAPMTRAARPSRRLKCSFATERGARPHRCTQRARTVAAGLQHAHAPRT